MIKSKLIYLYLFICLVLLFSCKNEKYKESDKLTGTLLWPADGAKILGADLEKNLSESLLFYENENYKNLLFPSKTKDSMIYVAMNEKNENEIIEVVNGNTISLIKKQDEILYPAKTENQGIIYIGVDKENNAYLGQLFADSNIDNILKDNNIDTDSRPSVSLSGSILYAEERGEKYWINIIDVNNKTQEIINGRYPIWIEDDNKFIYYYDRCIRQYELSTDTTQVIKKGIVIKTTPVLSPDKKYMAIFESNAVAIFGGETLDYLRIIPITSGKKINVKAYEPDIYHWGGYEWIE